MPDALTVEDRIRACERPSGRVAMHQNWRDLLFLHWKLDPETIQATLPPGLYVDTFDDGAWLGLVPFLMRDIRPPRLPSFPPVSNFLEMNLRTYVHDGKGRPGVWFYSLDANQPLAVLVAQNFFYLPYLRANMSDRREEKMIHYRCHRIGTPETTSTEIVYRGEDKLPAPLPGSLEYFLVERYLLFAYRKRTFRLYTGKVHHTPYPVCSAKAELIGSGVLEQAGFSLNGRAPDHALFSPGVDVDLYSLQRA